MKKFMLLYRGAWDGTPTQETMDAWSEWFAFLGDKIVDAGNPFGPGREITADRATQELPLDADALTGYTLINAHDLDEAEKLALQCPVVTSIRVYEAMPM